MGGDRVLLVDDHPLVGTVIGTELTSRGFDVRDVRTIDEALSTIAAWAPDLSLLDLDLGGRDDGLLLVRELTGRGHKVVMLTGSRNERTLGQALRMGALDVLSKTDDPSEILETVSRILDEGRAVEGDGRRARLVAAADAADREDRERFEPFDQLTVREAEVLAALVGGRSVDEIADQEYVSVATIRTHVRKVLEKLGVRSQLAAVAKARKAGWPPES